MIERYRLWYEHEIDSSDKMLRMIEGVPETKRDDPRFARALQLAGHLAACRENWLDRMSYSGENQVDWWPKNVELGSLRSRYTSLETAWRDYLSKLDTEELEKDFEFPIGNGRRYRWNIEGQIVQLVGHAHYHRGQIALLVDQLGSATVDTDYLYWASGRDKRWGYVEG